VNADFVVGRLRSDFVAKVGHCAGLANEDAHEAHKSWWCETTPLLLLYACPDGVARRGFK
jgi:hypothetical protein